MVYIKKIVLCNKLCNWDNVVKIEKVDIMSKVSKGKVVGANGRYNAQNQL